LFECPDRLLTAGQSLMVADEDITAIHNPYVMVTPNASLVTPNPHSVTRQESSARLVMQDHAMVPQAQVNEDSVLRSHANKLRQEVHDFHSKLVCNTMRVIYYLSTILFSYSGLHKRLLRWVT
jgi:hypothetical protein